MESGNTRAERQLQQLLVHLPLLERGTSEPILLKAPHATITDHKFHHLPCQVGSQVLACNASLLTVTEQRDGFDHGHDARSSCLCAACNDQMFFR
mmetsp:Transcript_5780/g.6645  ORF Transcript_5780/g.6645 Transcript_5780/m.6645 type:complete len:95 (-) Transcript_5780:486-770(-)